MVTEDFKKELFFWFDEPYRSLTLSIMEVIEGHLIEGEKPTLVEFDVINLPMLTKTRDAFNKWINEVMEYSCKKRNFCYVRTKSVGVNFSTIKMIIDEHPQEQMKQKIKRLEQMLAKVKPQD